MEEQANHLNVPSSLSSRSAAQRSFSRMKWPLGRWVVIIFLSLLLAESSISAPANWVQMNDDGFFGYPPTDTPTELFVFGSNLYAYDDHGLYQMQLSPCLEWSQLTVPIPPGSWVFRPVENVLYLNGGGGQLWTIGLGQAFSSSNWKLVTFNGPPIGASVVPMTLFNGWLYAAVYQAGLDTFDIWRSQDNGLQSMTWTKVVSNGFGDPENHALGFITVYKGKLLAATTATRSSSFGDPGGFGAGIEVWESASGDSGSWTQVNEDGFGTEITQVGAGASFRTNQDVGGFAVYNGQLYVGTKSHYGAEVWCYDGSGPGGWTEITPPWAGPSPTMSLPGRNMAMVAFQSDLYLAEGYSTGNLARYDGTEWTVVVPGPNPFDPTNGGLGSMAALGGNLYVATIHAPYSGGPVRGDQVYGYPYSTRPATCTKPKLPDLLFDPPKVRWLLTDHKVEVRSVLLNSGSASVGDYKIGYFLDGELIFEEKGPDLEPGEEIEQFFSYDVGMGVHEITLVIDTENQVDEAEEGNNEYAFTFEVGEREISPGVEDLWLEVEATRRCLPSGVTHELYVRWSAGEIPYEDLWLEVSYPDRPPETIDLWAPVGMTLIDLQLPDGGDVALTLNARMPFFDESTSVYVTLPPCTETLVGPRGGMGIAGGTGMG
jgi:hypothetical protein